MTRFHVRSRIYAQNMTTIRKANLRATVLVLLGTWVSTYGLSMLPLKDLKLKGPWLGISYHLISALSSLFLMSIFCRPKLKQLRITFAFKKLLPLTFCFAYLLVPNFSHANLLSFKLYYLLMALLFALSIGLDEELFSRGFIFGILEDSGLNKAIIISSIHFGLLHLGNYIWGNQSLSYTISQVFTAATFGFVCSSIVIFTRSYWPAVLLHAFSDFPMLLEGSSQYASNMKSSFDWVGTFLECLINIGVGGAILMLEKFGTSEALKMLFLKLGLTNKKIDDFYNLLF
jgi:membrane protease YdiL (CAAX protease family)